MPDTPRAALLAEIEKAARAVYFIAEESAQADELAVLLTRAAAEIRALEGQLEAAEQHVKILNESVESLGIQLTALRQDRERERAMLVRVLATVEEGNLSWTGAGCCPFCEMADIGTEQPPCELRAALAARQAGRTEG